MFENWQNLSGVVKSIPNDSLHVFRIDQGKYKTRLDDKLIASTLSMEEKARMNAFKFDKDRYTYATARYATRLISSKLLQVEPDQLSILLSEFGKPYLEDYAQLQFSISHSGDLIIIGFGNNDALGVDTEIHNQNIDFLELSQSVFSHQEMTSLRELDSHKLMDGFYNCWTKKESYIKAKGMGLQIPLDSFTVRLFDDGKHNLIHADEDFKETKKWQLFNFPISDRYKAGCCCNASIQSIVYWDITEEILTLS